MFQDTSEASFLQNILRDMFNEVPAMSYTHLNVINKPNGLSPNNYIGYSLFSLIVLLYLFSGEYFLLSLDENLEYYIFSPFSRMPIF